MLKINSNYKKLLKSFLILGLFSFSVQALATWVQPVSNPPGGNTLSPIHVGADPQTKVGGVVLYGLRIFGTGSVALFDGRVEIQGGSPGAGKVLTSDATGLASWEPPSAGGGPWIEDTGLVRLVNPNNHIRLEDNTIIYKNNPAGNVSKFIHTTGDNLTNTFVGRGSGSPTVPLFVTGVGNTGVGASTLTVLTTGTSNTAVGVSALSALTTGIRNTAVGVNALQNNNANSNTALGYIALQNNSSGEGNVAIGSGSLSINNTGSYNVGIGRNSSVGASASNSTAIGDTAVANANNATALGNQAFNDVANSMVFGNSAVLTNTFNGGVILTKNSNPTGNPAVVKPTCSSSNTAVRGMLWFTKNSSGKDSLELCARDPGGVLGWRLIY